MKKTVSSHLALFFLSSCSIFFPSFAEVLYKSTDINENEKQVALTIVLKEDELLYADTLTVEIDHPEVKMKELQILQPPIAMYDSTTKETQRVFEEHVEMLAHLIRHQKDIDKAHLHVTYATNKERYTVEKLIPILFRESTTTDIPTPQKTEEKKLSLSQRTTKKSSFSFTKYISGLLKTSNSLSLQLFLAFILGMLLSLTPCVYPMLPITVGILHSYGTQSFFGNAVRSLLYSMGIATTYALFGLLASCTGPLCGQLLAQPIFIYILVSFLAYLAGSMLGLYELYIPRFLQLQQTAFKAHSLWSVFLFGVASGTIASPCVSPGLALILSVVATMGNTLLGFLFLFLFGIGLSTPLLIVGTFSSSIHVMPKTGQWMVEIKKAFGFLLLALCIYYLKSITPWNIILFIIGLTLVGSGILYLVWARKIVSAKLKKAYNILGILLIALSVLFLTKSIQETFLPTLKTENNLWNTSFESALSEAQENNKLLFVDIWAQFCSICVAINSTILADEEVLETFKEHYILLKVDGTLSQSEPYASLQKRYAITGFPTFLIINPVTKEVIKRWDSKIYTMPKEKFIAKITHYASEFTRIASNH